MQLFICSNCAREALPMLVVDALVGPRADTTPQDCGRAIHDTRIDFDRRFWRASVSLLAALLRRGARDATRHTEVANAAGDELLDMC